MTALEQSLVATICWFDLWHHPLTTFECWYFLWDEAGFNRACQFMDVNKSLQALCARGVIKNERGFWQLNSSAGYAAERLARVRASISKRRRAAQAAKLIMRLPFVRLVALANTLATDAAKPDSDIDLFIVIKRGRLYLGRLLVTALTQMLGWRRHGRFVTDRLCLSFYVTDDKLNLQTLAYADDPYLAYWLASLYAWWEDSLIMGELLKANAWLKDLIPNRFKPAEFAANNNRGDSLFKISLEKLLAGRLGQLLEGAAKQLQLHLIHKHTNSRLGDGTPAVVVSDQVLKFHESDRRPELALAWRTKLKNLCA